MNVRTIPTLFSDGNKKRSPSDASASQGLGILLEVIRTYKILLEAVYIDKTAEGWFDLRFVSLLSFGNP